jgi:2',3'-cyclic-nucleotide 2'-phosphodiesterase (5'-nucleotidase family)
VPKYATLIAEIRADTENVLLLDGGDIFRRGPFQRFLGETETAVMNAMGYDAFVFGNNDFPRRGEMPGMSHHPIIQLAEFPVLCANVTIDGEMIPGIQPFTIINAGGLDIAIIGVTSMKPHNRDEYASEWADFAEPEDVVAEQLELVRGISDIQIVLSHAGIEADRRMRGVSAIIGGDDHLRLNEPAVVHDNGIDIPIVQAGGEENHYLGRLDLIYELIDGVWVLYSFHGRLFSVDGVAPDIEIEQIIGEWAALDLAA